MNTPAWRAMSHGARSLYMLLRSFYGKNQNAVYCSTREAQEALGAFSRRESICRWYRELEYYGFIRQVSGACLGLDGKGKAAHWRLTECGYMGELPTREYLRWDGTKFKDHRQKPPSYYLRRDRICAFKKQNPGLTRRSTLDSHPGPPLDRQVSPLEPKNGPAGESIGKPQTGPAGGSITTLPLVGTETEPPLYAISTYTKPKAS